MNPSSDIPQSAHEIRVKSTLAARHFGQVVGGKIEAVRQIYNSGDIVKHCKFSRGTIISSINVGNDEMLEINFDNIGNKKLMANFARLEKV